MSGSDDRMSASSTAAVVFDCDGVLVDSEAPVIAIDQRMLADFGVELTLEEVHARFVGITEAAYHAEIEKMVGQLPDGWRDPYHSLYLRALHEDLQPIAGVGDVIAGLTLPTAVASNSSRIRVRESLELVGLLHFFDDRIVSAEDVPHGKPAPDVYLRAAELLRVPAASCVAVEDSTTGVRAARSAGMTVLGYVDGLTPGHALRSAGAITFGSMTELPALLDELA